MKRTILIFILIVLVALPIFSHRPIMKKDYADGIIPIKNMSTSQVVYQDIDKEGKQVWLSFQGKAGEEITFNIGMPYIERLKDFRPHAALLGPGLPLLEERFGIMERGIIYHTHMLEFKDFREFNEPFTGTDSWILLERSIILPEDGTYYLVGYAKEEDNNPGRKFWISVGEKERFGLGDLFAFGNWKKKIREFHEIK